MDERIKKDIYTMECYSVIKRNTFESVLKMWMTLEPVIQSEVSQKEENKYRILTHIYGIKNLFAEQQWRGRHREQTYGHRVIGGRRGWDEWRE